MGLKGVAGGVGGTIGGAVINGTAGSILGVGPGGLLAETGQSMTSDAAATSMLLKSFNAYPQAATNTSGANTILAGGIGRRIVTVVDYSLIDAGVDTITLTINGTANVGTEGTQDATHWKAQTSNAVTAANIATWASQLTGVSATSSGDVAYITADVGTYSVTLATSMAAGEGTVTSGTDGGISLQGTDAFITRYAAKQVMISGDGVGATTNAGWILGMPTAGASGYGYLFASSLIPSTANWALAQGAAGDTLFNSAVGQSLIFSIGGSSNPKITVNATAGAGPSITAGTTADNTNRALSISQTWTDGTTSNIGIVGNFDMGATGTATGKLLSLQAGAAGTTEVSYIDYLGVGLFSGIRLTTLAVSATAPTLASGGCTSPTAVTANGTARFSIGVGTSCSGSQPLVFTLPAATTSWKCTARNVTNGASSLPDQTGALSTTSVTITSFSRTLGTAQAWTDSDVVEVTCMGG